MQHQMTLNDYVQGGFYLFLASAICFAVGALFYFIPNKVEWDGVGTNFLAAYFFGMAYTILFFFGGVFLFFLLLDTIFIITGVIR